MEKQKGSSGARKLSFKKIIIIINLFVLFVISCRVNKNKNNKIEYIKFINTT